MSAAAEASTRNGALHIGAVCRQLRDEFPEISISKIRYLEDQGLLAPKRFSSVTARMISRSVSSSSCSPSRRSPLITP